MSNVVTSPLPLYKTKMTALKVLTICLARQLHRQVSYCRFDFPGKTEICSNWSEANEKRILIMIWYSVDAFLWIIQYIARGPLVILASKRECIGQHEQMKRTSIASFECRKMNMTTWQKKSPLRPLLQLTPLLWNIITHRSASNTIDLFFVPNKIDSSVFRLRVFLYFAAQKPFVKSKRSNNGRFRW